MASAHLSTSPSESSVNPVSLCFAAADAAIA